MKDNQRPAVFVSVVGLAVIFCAAWAWEYLDDQRSAAAAAAVELADCRDLGRRIVASRLNAVTTARPADLTTAISTAAMSSGLAPESLDHIDPSSARRAADGSGSEKQIDLSIRQGTLGQIVTFAHALSVAPLSLCVERLRLTPSPSDGGGWGAEMTLTCPDTDDRGR
ncbi:MAG: hypothetical protein ABSH22_08050 [Tepidisphaeraceae bacterium]|jgi:hypothetical protein